MYKITARMLLISAVCMLAMAFAATGAFAQNAASLAGGKAETVYKDIKVMQGTPADQLIATMQFFEASLGVTCEHCHLATRETSSIVSVNPIGFFIGFVLFSLSATELIVLGLR